MLQLATIAKAIGVSYDRVQHSCGGDVPKERINVLKNF